MHHQRRSRVPWSTLEDQKLRTYVTIHGNHHWDDVARNLGLGRSGNSCRLRWVNYLSPHIRRGNFTHHEMLLILTLHFELGTQWSRIAQHLPGRTDNDIKNFWNTKMKKEAKLLNIGDLRSPEFLHIMTERIQARAPSDYDEYVQELMMSDVESTWSALPPLDESAGGSTAASLVAASSSDDHTGTVDVANNSHDDPSSTQDELANIGSIWTNLDQPPPFDIYFLS